MSTVDNNATFDAIVVAFDDQLPCAIVTLSGDQCRRTASWRIDLHGCEQGNACGHHKNSLIRSAEIAKRYGRTLCCHHCRREFDCVADIVKVVAI